MTTLRVHASHVPEAWPIPRFTQIAAFIGAFIDVFAEAQTMARVAHKRYPFIEE